MEINILQFIVANKYDLLKLGLFLTINKYLLDYIIERKKLVREYQAIKSHKIVTIQQALQIQKSKNQIINPKSNKNSKPPSTTYLIKVQPQSNQKNIQVHQQIRSNQFWYIQPSLNGIGQQIMEIYNEFKIGKLDTKIQFEVQKMFQLVTLNNQWKIKNQSKSINIHGFGRIVDHEIFDISCSYKINEKRGFFKSIYQNFAYLLEFIFFLKYNQHDTLEKKNLSLNSRRSPVIKGPVIGNIKYLFNFMANRYILLQAKIQDGKLLPLIISSSRGKILDYFSEQIFSLNSKILVCLISSLFVYRTFHKFAKKRFKQLKDIVVQRLFKRNIVKPRQKFQPIPDDLGQDKLCIICYTNCRNTILFNCRHIIMCQSCKQSYKNQTCPLCKEQIQDQMVLHKF